MNEYITIKTYDEIKKSKKTYEVEFHQLSTSYMNSTIFVLNELKDDTADIDILKYVSDNLKNDKKIVMTALYKKHYIETYKLRRLDICGRELPIEEQQHILIDKKEDFEVTKKIGLLLQHASKRLQDDKEVVKLAVEKNGLALKYASDNLKNDKEIVIIAIRNNPYSLEFASDNLKNDKEVVKLAINKNKLVAKYAGKKLLCDKEILLLLYPALEYSPIWENFMIDTYNYLDIISNDLNNMNEENK